MTSGSAVVVSSAPHHWTMLLFARCTRSKTLPALAAGLDPTVGFLHRSESPRPVRSGVGWSRDERRGRRRPRAAPVGDPVPAAAEPSAPAGHARGRAPLQTWLAPRHAGRERNGVLARRKGGGSDNPGARPRQDGRMAGPAGRLPVEPVDPGRSESTTCPGPVEAVNVKKLQVTSCLPCRRIVDSSGSVRLSDHQKIRPVDDAVGPFVAKRERIQMASWMVFTILSALVIATGVVTQWRSILRVFLIAGLALMIIGAVVVVSVIGQVR